MSNVKEIQQRLKLLGFDPGPIDGKRGPKTTKAIKAFQTSVGLTADGLVGPLTEEKLFPTGDLDRPEGVMPEKPIEGNLEYDWPFQKDCMKFYGGVGVHQTKLSLPFEMRIAWDKKIIIKAFSVHEKVHDSASRCFNRIADAYDEKARNDTGINLFGGCLNVRRMRGGRSYSMHSWGIAIDFDPERNQLKWGRDKARLAKPDCVTFWKIWEDEGWVSLGREKNFDWMHVQAAKL